MLVSIDGILGNIFGNNVLWIQIFQSYGFFLYFDGFRDFMNFIYQICFQKFQGVYSIRGCLFRIIQNVFYNIGVFF